MKLTQATMDAILADLIATGGVFDEADTYIGVSPTIVDLGQATTMANVTAATGAVATRVLVTAWGTPYNKADGRRAVDAPIASFRPASSAQAQTIAWWFLADAATAGNLIAFDSIGEEIPLPDENSQWSIVLTLTVDPDGRWSTELTWNG